ncbi:hypothetical protein D9619_009236 [Psilocybe cf. subviscida]|uniref:Glycosyltransferase family 20 protein n=1 Tax=Psilocybe cf. subviscida TaxID=2480587 RepID=A0A8H5BVP5_9AGAR|nr:hypothetical protein D9619_009236 [Psilocybe cf. subviscida]
MVTSSVVISSLITFSFSSLMATSFRTHRVIIASLFLPTTVVVGESEPATPTHEAVLEHGGSTRGGIVADTNDARADTIIPSVMSRLADNMRPAFLRTHSRAPSASGPLKSIVDDLKDKSRIMTPVVGSPTVENANPFAAPKSTRFQDPPDTQPRKTPNIRRKQSRSSSRAAARRPSNLREEVPAWHTAPNPHCNGGLKNAVDSVADRMKQRVWVGTLGVPTDAFSDALRTEIDTRLIKPEKKETPCHPVYVPDAEFTSAYEEFCHQVLWPALHYAVPDAPKTRLFYESASYAQYVALNKRFAEAIISVYQPGDIIWINDYHLLLLPTLLRMSPLIPVTAPIGFFMHVAFPSSEIFRCLSVRKDLLRGMLGADLVGFQTANYARHWRQTVSRILSFEALPRGIQVPEGAGLTVGDVDGEGVPSKVRDGAVERGRFVDVNVFPMGIDVKALHNRRQEPEVAQWVNALKQRYPGMKLLVGRDKLDEIQGVRHKLDAFELFLTRNPEYQGKVVLIQVALQTSSSFSTLSSTSAGSTNTKDDGPAGDVMDSVARINSRFSTLTYQPVVFLHTPLTPSAAPAKPPSATYPAPTVASLSSESGLTFSQYLALLTAADAFIVTSLREGMALRTHEFVECQSEAHNPLILSEFTGSYSYSGFRSCIAVNPYDARGTAAAIKQAFEMDKAEKEERWSELHSHVCTQTSQAFVVGFLNRTLRANNEHTESLDADADLEAGDESDAGDPEAAMGVGRRLKKVPRLVEAALVPRYKHSRQRLVLVDFEGTLWHRDLRKEAVLDAQRPFPLRQNSTASVSESSSGMVSPSESVSGLSISTSPTLVEAPEHSAGAEGGRDLPVEVQSTIELLRKLSANTRNEVWLLSGLRVRGVLEAIAERVPKVGIVAENGCFIKTRAMSGPGGRGLSAPGEWINMVANFSLTWKAPCLEILNYFTERTPGSFIEERAASMVWRFWTGEDGADSSDRAWAQRQAGEAQNHIFDSLGERYGLRIIPGRNSFLILPNNVSRSSAVGAILNPGGPARRPHSARLGSLASPSALEDFTGTVTTSKFGGAPLSPAAENFASSGGYGGPGMERSHSGVGHEDHDFMLAVSSDEKLLRRLNEFDIAETVSTSGRGTDAKWKLDSEEASSALNIFANVA